MALLGVGIVLLLLKLLAVGPVAAWPWWWVLGPFALAVVWWTWADWSGYTQRRAADRLARRQQARTRRQREALNRPPRPRR